MRPSSGLLSNAETTFKFLQRNAFHFAAVHSFPRIFSRNKIHQVTQRCSVVPALAGIWKPSDRQGHANESA